MTMISSHQPAPGASAASVANRRAAATPAAEQDFASLLTADAGATAVPIAQPVSRTIEGAAAPAVQAFNALGVFGDIGTCATTDDRVDAAPASQMAWSEPGATAQSASGLQPMQDDDRASTPTWNDIVYGNAIAPAAAAPGTGSPDWITARTDRVSGGPLLVALMMPRAASTISPSPTADEETMPVPTREVIAMAFVRSQQEPAPVSVTISGEGHVLQVVARADVGDQQDHDTLRQIIERTVNEQGLSLGTLHLNGTRMTASPFAMGDQHGR